jgi:uncharacterized phage-associated protein
MSLRSIFDAEKAVEVLLYIASRVPDTYHALKVLYFADKEHLSRYGRLICGDSYTAMPYGPVPSNTYDLVKHVRGDGYCNVDFPVDEAFSVNGNDIVCKRAADEDYLSESDIECLDEAIGNYGYLSFGKLKRLSHQDRAFAETSLNDFIPLEAIIQSLPEGELLLDYLNSD